MLPEVRVDSFTRVHDEFFDLGEITIHAATAGNGGPVVLLHGFPEFWYSWRFQIPALVGASRRVIALDLRGYNLSSKPRGVAEYSITAVADDVVRVIGRLGERVALVGHDWGGVIAWRVARIAPHLLDRLVIVNIPHPRAIADAIRSPRQAMRFAYQIPLQFPLLPEKLLTRNSCALLRHLLKRGVRRREAVTHDDLERYVEAWTRPDAMTSMLNYYRAVARKTPSRHARNAAPDSPPPTLLVCGDREPVFLQETLHASRDYLPAITIETIRRAGHFAHQDDPERFNQLLLGFL